MKGRRALVGVITSAALVSTLGVQVSVQAQQPGEPRTGGRLVVAAEFDPGALNHWLICCTLQWTRYMVDGLLPDAYAQTPDFRFVPELLDREAEMTLDPFTVTYSIKEEAEWSDGVPVSADDFVFTARAYKDEQNQVAERRGYELIRKVTVSDAKTVTFEFRKPYPEYKSLFTDVFPKHILQDKNLNRAWRRSIPISAGPFMFKEYVRGSHLTLVRNDNYWADHLAYLDEVEFRFFRTIDEQVAALEAGEVDVIYPSLHPSLAEARTLPGIEVQNSASQVWEHLDMQFADRLLNKPFVRRAIATAIDREAILDAIIRPIDPGAEVLQSILYGVGEPEYEPHFGSYDGDPQAARAILEDHGCETDADGIYECGRRPLRFVYHTTTVNPIRRQLAGSIRDQLEVAGIEIEVRRRPAPVVFGPRILVSGHFDLFNFAWVQIDPSGEYEIWRCSGSQNFTNYCNRDVDALFDEASTETDSVRFARLTNLADEAMARDVATLPLYQKPTFLAYSDEVGGMIDNPTQEGFTWNIGDWWLDSGP